MKIKLQQMQEILRQQIENGEGVDVGKMRTEVVAVDWMILLQRSNEMDD